MIILILNSKKLLQKAYSKSSLQINFLVQKTNINSYLTKQFKEFFDQDPTIIPPKKLLLGSKNYLPNRTKVYPFLKLGLDAIPNDS